MTDKPSDPATASVSPAGRREAALRDSLRSNLRRRKDQARAREEPADRPRDPHLPEPDQAG